MGRSQRTKGAGGERELAAALRALTGHDVRRLVRQHDGDHDLLGLPGWAIEVKRYGAATPALVASWWQQAVLQAARAQLAQPGRAVRPLLFYRLDRGAWRACWAPTPNTTLMVESALATWWALEDRRGQALAEDSTSSHGSFHDSSRHG